MSQHIYLLEDHGVKTWIAAPNLVAAINVLHDEYGDDIPEGTIGDDWTLKALSDTSNLTLRMVDEDGQPQITKTCAEWANASPASVIGCTEY